MGLFCCEPTEWRERKGGILVGAWFARVSLRYLVSGIRESAIALGQNTIHNHQIMVENNKEMEQSSKNPDYSTENPRFW